MWTGNYSGTPLAEALHSLPHLDHSLNVVDADFALTVPYAVSVILAAAPFVLVGLLACVTLVAGLMCKCCCCCCSPPQLTYGKHSKGYFVLLGITIVLAAGAFVGGVIANVGADTGVNGIINSAIDLNTTLASSVVDANSLIAQMDSLSNAVNDYVANSQGLPQYNQIVQESTALLSSVQDAKGEINSATGAASDIVLSPSITDSTSEINEDRSIGQFCILAVMPIAVGLVVVGRIVRSSMIMYLGAVLGLVWMIPGWTCAGAEMSASLAIADFCVQPNQNVQTLSKDDITGTPGDLLVYYLQCNANQVSPLQPFMDGAFSNLNNAFARSDTLASIAATSGRQVLIDDSVLIANSLNATINATGILQNKLSCPEIHEEYANGIIDLCEASLPAVFALSLTQSLGGLAVLIASIAALKMMSYFDDRLLMIPPARIYAHDEFIQAPLLDQQGGGGGHAGGGNYNNKNNGDKMMFNV